MARTQREVVSLVLMMVVTLVTGDINKDKQECADQLAGLATCLQYVGGEAKAPTIDCCTGLKQVIKDSKKCLCELVKDRNDPSLGINVNATLALGLPQKCHASDANVSECPALLHLAPDSPEAKVFSDFGKAAAPSSKNNTAAASSKKSSGSTPTASANDTNNGVVGKRWVPWSVALLLYIITSYLLF